MRGVVRCGVRVDHDELGRVAVGTVRRLDRPLDRPAAVDRDALLVDAAETGRRVGGVVPCVVLRCEHRGGVVRRVGLHLVDVALREIAGAEQVERQTVHGRQSVRPHGELVRTGGERRHRERDRGVRPGGRGDGRCDAGRVRQREPALGTETGALQRVDVRRVVSRDVVRPVDAVDHRVRGLELAETHGAELGGGTFDRDADVGRRLVDRVDHTGPTLELGADRAELRAVVGVRVVERAGVVADQAVHVRARAGRQWAVVGVGRGQQHLVEAVRVAVRRELPVAELVVDADRAVRHRGDLAEHDAATVGLHVEVVVDQAVELRRQRYRRVHEERRVRRATVHDGDELVATRRDAVAGVRAAADAFEVGVHTRVVRRHRVQAADACCVTPGGERVLVDPDLAVRDVQQLAGAGRLAVRRVLLRDVRVAGRDVDRCLVGEVVEVAGVTRLARDRVDGAHRLDHVVGGRERGREVLRVRPFVVGRRVARSGVDRRPEGIVAVDRAVATDLQTVHRPLDAVRVGRVAVAVVGRCRRRRKGLLASELVALHVEGNAAGRAGPALGGVVAERLAALPGVHGVGAEIAGATGAGRAAGGDADLQRRSAIGRRVVVDDTGGLARAPELHRDARHRRLVVLGERLAGVQLVTGRVVGDRPGDAAVRPLVVGLHAPVDVGREADDREEVDVDLRGQHGVGDVVVGLVGVAGVAEAGVVRLEDQELPERVALREVEVALVVGHRRGRALVDERVAAGADRHEEVGYTALVGIADAVAVGVDEDRPLDVGEPAGQEHVGHLGGETVVDVVLQRGEDVALRLVPQGDAVVAGLQAGHGERAVRLGPPDPHGRVGRGGAAGEAVDRDDAVLDRAVGLGVGQVRAGERRRTRGTDERPADLEGSRQDASATRHGGAVVRRVRRGVTRERAVEEIVVVALLHEAERDRGDALATDDQLGVVPGGAFLVPRIPVVATFERGGLDPLRLALRRGVRRHDRDGVAVRPHVRDLDVAVVVGDAQRLGAVELAAGDTVVGEGHRRGRAVVGEQYVAARVLDVLGAQRVAVDVGGHLGEHVGHVGDEARHVGGRIGNHERVDHAVARRIGGHDRRATAGDERLGLAVPLPVGGRVVVEDVHADRVRLLRERVHRDDEVLALRRDTVGQEAVALAVQRGHVVVGIDREVRAVDLEVERGHRDEVPAGRKVRLHPGDVGLGAARHDGGVARRGVDGGPRAVAQRQGTGDVVLGERSVGKRGRNRLGRRRQARRDRLRRLGGVAGAAVVADEPLERGDHVALVDELVVRRRATGGAAADHLEMDAGDGVRRRGAGRGLVQRHRQQAEHEAHGSRQGTDLAPQPALWTHRCIPASPAPRAFVIRPQ